MSQKPDAKIKDMIVNAYKRGVCDHNGETIPKSKRGMAGKGSHFGPRLDANYGENYDQIKWS